MTRAGKMVKHFIALALATAAAPSNSISRTGCHNSRLPVGWQCHTQLLEHRSSSSLTLRRGALVRSGVVCTFLTGGALLSRALSKQVKKSASMTIIDSAVHVWKEDEGYPWAKEAAANPPAKDATAEELQTLMDANQVDKTVLIQPICYRYDNSFVKDTMRKYPDRFAAVARVDPENVNATAQLEDLMAVGFKGVRFGPVEKSWWNSENMSSVLRKAEELEVPVLLFLGKDGGRSIPWIKPVLLKFPNLRVVIDHMADVSPTDPQQIDELLALASLPKIYVKLSHTWALSQQGYPWRDAQELVKRVVSAFGASRCMFATDWPVCMMPTWPGGNTTYADTVRLAKEEYATFLSAEELELILGGTAADIWFPELKSSKGWDENRNLSMNRVSKK